MDLITLKAEIEHRLANRPHKFYSLNKLFEDIIPSINKNVGDDCVSISEKIFRVLNGIIDSPLCEICNQIIRWNAKRSNYGRYCSLQCANDIKSSRTRAAHATMLDNGGIGAGNPLTKVKVVETNLERYGVENIGTITREKAWKTFKENTGYSHAWYDPSIRSKMVESQLNTFSSEEYIERRKEASKCIKNRTNLKYIERAEENGYSANIINEDIIKFTHDCGNTFEVNFNNYKRRQWKDSMIKCSVCFPNSVSLEHRLVLDFLDELGVEYITNDRSLIRPLELDIYIPNCSLAIEVNGCFWHSEYNGKDSNYHLNKTKLCKEKNVRLLHFFDFEINNKFAVVQNIIRNSLGLRNNIAPKGEYVEVSCDFVRNFVESHHLLGFIEADRWYAIMEDSEIISVGGIIGRDECCDIVRFCSNNNTEYFRIFTQMVREHYEVDYLKFTIDCRFEDISDYDLKIGPIDKIDPKCFYISTVDGARKLSNDDNELNYYRVWDCGEETYKIIYT